MSSTGLAKIVVKILINRVVTSVVFLVTYIKKETLVKLRKQKGYFVKEEKLLKSCMYANRAINEGNSKKCNQVQEMNESGINGEAHHTIF